MTQRLSDIRAFSISSIENDLDAKTVLFRLGVHFKEFDDLANPIKCGSGFYRLTMLNDYRFVLNLTAISSDNENESQFYGIVADKNQGSQIILAERYSLLEIIFCVVSIVVGAFVGLIGLLVISSIWMFVFIRKKKASIKRLEKARREIEEALKTS